MSSPFVDQVVLITGASSGIGRSLAHRLARDGARVIGTGRDQEALATLAPEVALALTMDVTDPTSVEFATRTALDAFGRVDVLINNAGIGLFRDWQATEVADIERLMEVNLYGAVRVTRALLPGMVERGAGLITNIASVSGKRGYALHTAYCATKFGLIGWSEALRAELTGTGVDLVIACPPAVDTPFFARAGAPERGKRGFGRGVAEVGWTADAIVDAMVARKPLAILGARARLLYTLSRLSPGALAGLQRLKR